MGVRVGVRVRVGKLRVRHVSGNIRRSGVAVYPLNQAHLPRIETEATQHVLLLPLLLLALLLPLLLTCPASRPKRRSMCGERMGLSVSHTAAHATTW